MTNMRSKVEKGTTRKRSLRDGGSGLERGGVCVIGGHDATRECDGGERRRLSSPLASEEGVKL
jgi:hypothetical protein